MIVYKLACKNGHDFDAWFRSSGDCDAQLAAGSVACPACGSEEVAKALMAPRLGRGEAAARQPAATPDAAPDAAPARVTNAPLPAAPEPLVQMLRAMRRHVEQNCDYVGDRFAEEARKMHRGENDRRDIYGEASREDARRLEEEGIDVYAIPWLPPHDA